MSTWSQQSALDHMRTDYRLNEILKSEPRLQKILDHAIYQECDASYDRIRTYLALRNQLFPLVGWHAAKPELQNSADYQLVIETLIDLLPPDHTDLNIQRRPQIIDRDYIFADA